MTQLQLPDNVATDGDFNDFEACQQSLARALRCRMILQNVHGHGGNGIPQSIRKRLTELERQIDEAQQRLAEFGRWH